MRGLVRERIREYYWGHHWNCAVTTLRVLAEVFEVPLHRQVLDAALGMHGAGGYRAQCGLVEGALMFVGVGGKAQGLDGAAVAEACYDFAEQFEGQFGSLLCRDLRPGGLSPDDPPHLCEELSREALLFGVAFVSEWMERSKS
ncbi:MAG: C-GCAxxG-C-C family protein [Anaerolineae bacterium]